MSNLSQKVDKKKVSGVVISLRCVKKVCIVSFQIINLEDNGELKQGHVGRVS